MHAVTLACLRSKCIFHWKASLSLWYCCRTIFLHATPHQHSMPYSLFIDHWNRCNWYTCYLTIS